MKIPNPARAKTDTPLQCNCCIWFSRVTMRDGEPIFFARLGPAWAMSKTKWRAAVLVRRRRAAMKEENR